MNTEAVKTLYLKIVSFRIIDLYLEKLSYNYKIVKDLELEISMSVLTSKTKELIQKGKGGKANKLIYLTGGENIFIQQNETDAHNQETRLTC